MGNLRHTGDVESILALDCALKSGKKNNKRERKTDEAKFLRIDGNVADSICLPSLAFRWVHLHLGPANKAIPLGAGCEGDAGSEGVVGR